MSLAIGIVGLPNVGKSTLFNALTDNHVLAANYPFATIEPNTGVVPVPDPRLHKLAAMYKSEKVVPATVTFVDIAGLVAGASKGEGLGNQFLSHIRSCNAIVQVVRAFEDPNVSHVDDAHSPQRDIETIMTELILADLQTVENRLPRLQKEIKADPKIKPLYALLVEVHDVLDSGHGALSYVTGIEDDPRHWLQQELQLLTLKPMLYVFNVDESGLNNDGVKAELAKSVAPASALFICAKLESELRELDANDAEELLASYGAMESGLIQLINAAYDTLGLQSYLTAGQKEVRAWTIPKGATAPQAAGVIHSDFERGFIAAQVIDYNELVKAGSEVAARSAGKIATVGKDYIMRPNDVVEFRFNISK